MGEHLHFGALGAMPSVQIKDVPEETHRLLRERAARAHQSLQEYLGSRLIVDAQQATLDEVFDRIATRRGGSLPFSEAANLPLRWASHHPFLRRIWELQHSVRAYGVAYVALAEALKVPLVTADAR